MWLIIVAVTGLQWWQAATGWPLRCGAAIRIQPGQPAASGLIEGRIRPDFYRVPWNTPMLRVRAGDTDLPKFPSLTQLEGAGVPGCHVHGHVIVLRPPAREAGTSLPTFTAQVPWHASPRAMCGWSLGLCFATGVLLRAGNVTLRGWAERLRGVPWLSGLLVLAVAGAMLLRAGGLAFPYWTNDTADYVRPALQLHAGLPAEPTQRTLGYALPVSAVLGCGGDFQTVLRLQQTGSVLAGLGLALLIRTAGRRLFSPGWLRVLAGAAGVLAMTFFGLHEAIVQRDWALLPEAGCAVYIVAQLWLTWHMVARPLSARRLLFEFALLNALGWLTFLSRPNWGLALAFLLVPLITAVALRSSLRPRFRMLGAAGLAIMVCMGGLALGLQALRPADARWSMDIRAQVLLCWHIDLVRPEITRRLLEKPTRADRALLTEIGAAMEEERSLSRRLGPGAYQLLGHDGDRLFYFGMEKAALYRGLEPAERIRFSQELFQAALRHAPSVYLHKVGRQMSNLLRHPYDSGYIYFPGVLSSFRQSEAIAAAPPRYFTGALPQGYAAELAPAGRILSGPWPSPVRMLLSERVASLVVWMTWGLGWSIGLPLACTLAAALRPAWRGRVPWEALAPVLSTAVWASGSVLGSALTCSLAQALEIQRYLDLFMPLTIASELLWPLIGACVVAALCERRPSLGAVPGSEGAVLPAVPACILPPPASGERLTPGIFPKP